MKTWVRVVILMFVSFMISVTGAFSMDELNLIPKPLEMSILAGDCVINGNWKICLNPENETEKYAAELINEEVKTTFGFLLKTCGKKSDNYVILLKMINTNPKEPRIFNEQGYYLTVSKDKIYVEAPANQGIFYGAQTLRQLIRLSKEQKIPCLKIKDYPTLQWRGISDDISRGQVSTVENFKDIIRELAFYKKNLYQPYIEDMFAFNYDEKIGRDRGAITPEEMKEMAVEAKKNFVTLCPVFECLGHQDRLLSLPGNRKYAEVKDEDKRPWSFSPVSEEALQYVKALIDELAKVTPSPFFHIGGDESFDIGTGDSKDEVERIGVGQVHANYFAKLNEHIQTNLNRRMLLYSDMLNRHPEALKTMPKDAIMVDWHYSPVNDFPTVKQLKNAGFDVMVSPGIWSWECFYPNFSIALKNVSELVRVGKEQKAMGSITSSWGDNGNENIRENNMPAYAFSAAVEWQPDAVDTNTFMMRFADMYYGGAGKEMGEVITSLGWHEYIDDIYPSRIFHSGLKLRKIPSKRIQQMEILEQNMIKANESLKEARGKVRLNAEHLDIIENVIKRYLYLAKREKTITAISKELLGRKASELSSERRDEFIDCLRELRGDLTKIKKEYADLWVRTNKNPKLDFNLDRLERQAEGLTKMIDAVKSGELTLPIEPDPVFFWYPDPDPKKDTEEGSRYFVKTITLDEIPESAEIKCWADDKASVFINGKRALSVEYGNVPMEKSVKDNLKLGENFIAIEAANAIGAACVVFHLKIESAGKKVSFVLPDETWFSSKKVEGEWKISKPEGDKWRDTLILGSGIVAPWDFLEW